MKKLLTYIRDKPEVLEYLPDINFENPRMVYREHLVNIMATLDNEFFDRAVDEAKRNRQKNKDDEINEVQMDPRLAKALEEFVNLRKATGRSSIGFLKPDVKPRKCRKRRRVEDLTTSFRVKRIKRNE